MRQVAEVPAGTAVRQAAAVLASPNVLSALPNLTVPTMVVHGELDPLIPFTSAVAAAQAIPGAAFLGLPGLGHDLPAAVALDLIERVNDFHALAVRA
jgi:pimeloyl-ACP methyl ester carboxylesterase